MLTGRDKTRLAVSLTRERPGLVPGTGGILGGAASFTTYETISLVSILRNGDLTGRGNPYLRGRAALIVALAMIAFELTTLAWIRWRFFSTGFLRSFVSIALGGAIISSVSAALGTVS